MDRMQEQIRELEDWKTRQIRLLQRVFRWLALALLIYVVGGVWALWQIHELAEENRQLTEQVAQTAKTNSELIRQVDALNVAQSDRAYDECRARNQRTATSQAELRKLNKALVKDGSMNEAVFWQDYLKKLAKEKPPSCTKPEGYDERKKENA